MSDAWINMLRRVREHAEKHTLDVRYTDTPVAYTNGKEIRIPYVNEQEEQWKADKILADVSGLTPSGVRRLRKQNRKALVYVVKAGARAREQAIEFASQCALDGVPYAAIYGIVEEWLP